MVRKRSTEYSGVWGFGGRYYSLVGSAIPDWEPTGNLLYDEASENAYSEVRWVDPDPWRGERVWGIKEARAVARELIARMDVVALRLIRFDRNSDDVLTINNIVEIETQFNRNKYPYGSGIDRFIKEWCSAKCLFSFEIVDKEYYHGM